MDVFFPWDSYGRVPRHLLGLGNELQGDQPHLEIRCKNLCCRCILSGGDVSGLSIRFPKGSVSQNEGVL
jgi:hypothetical protein